MITVLLNTVIESCFQMTYFKHINNRNYNRIKNTPNTVMMFYGELVCIYIVDLCKLIPIYSISMQVSE